MQITAFIKKYLESPDETYFKLLESDAAGKEIIWTVHLLPKELRKVFYSELKEREGLSPRELYRLIKMQDKIVEVCTTLLSKKKKLIDIAVENDIPIATLHKMVTTDINAISKEMAYNCKILLKRNKREQRPKREDVSLALKKKVLKEYLNTDKTMEELGNKYNINYITLMRAVRAYADTLPENERAEYYNMTRVRMYGQDTQRRMLNLKRTKQRREYIRKEASMKRYTIIAKEMSMSYSCIASAIYIGRKMNGGI